MDMGIDNLQPCQDDEDEADDLFDSPSSSKAQPERRTPVYHQPTFPAGAAAQPRQLASHRLHSTSISTSAHLNVSVHSNSERLPVRATPPAKLQDLRELLWRRFGLGPGVYTVTLAPLALQADAPLVMQTVCEGCKIMLHLSNLLTENAAQRST